VDSKDRERLSYENGAAPFQAAGQRRGGQYTYVDNLGVMGFDVGPVSDCLDATTRRWNEPVDALRADERPMQIRVR
jgi:hypothetical protein